MKIYTKTGDKGETGLLGGDRIAKTSPRIRAIGAIDELNATLGIAHAFADESSLQGQIQRIQNWLFDLGSELACPPGGKFELISVGSKHLTELEQSMDQQTAGLPPLRNFILPGGTALAAHLHLARCVCRRVELEVLDLSEVEPVRTDLLIFLNRLSDWLFTSARTANLQANVEDVKWAKEGVE